VGGSAFYFVASVGSLGITRATGAFRVSSLRSEPLFTLIAGCYWHYIFCLRFYLHLPCFQFVHGYVDGSQRAALAQPAEPESSPTKVNMGRRKSIAPTTMTKGPTLKISTTSVKRTGTHVCILTFGFLYLGSVVDFLYLECDLFSQVNDEESTNEDNDSENDIDVERYTCMHVHTHVCTFTCINFCIYVCTYACLLVCLFVTLDDHFS
jgi:hypothetical protein